MNVKNFTIKNIKENEQDTRSSDDSRSPADGNAFVPVNLWMIRKKKSL